MPVSYTHLSAPRANIPIAGILSQATKGDQIVRKDVDIDSDEDGRPGEDQALRKTVSRRVGSGAQHEQYGEADQADERDTALGLSCRLSDYEHRGDACQDDRRNTAKG